MMSSILLLSADQTLEKTMRAALPRSVSLQVVNHSLSQPFPEKLDTAAKPVLILVDASKRLDVASWLPASGQVGLTVVAIISDPGERQALFQAGVHDYLLKPLVPEEIKARLSPYLQEPDIGNTQKNQSVQMLEHESRELLTRQMIQNERWITIGRLIASICHDITNRMQATQGALSLATEEPALSDDMRAFLSICQQETGRVSAQVERLRHIYHPEIDPVVMIDIAELLEEVRTLASDAITIRGVTVEMSLTDDLPVIRGRMGQLQFALLGLLLNLVDLINSEKGGRIRVEAGTIGPTVQIGFSTDAPLSIFSNQNQAAESESPRRILEYALGLPTMQQVIFAQNGDIGLLLNDPGLSVWLSLPIS